MVKSSGASSAAWFFLSVRAALHPIERESTNHPRRRGNR
jgi:hypothetical protein